MSVTSITSTSLQPRPVIESRRTGSASTGTALRNQAAPRATPPSPAAARSATSPRRRARPALLPGRPGVDTSAEPRSGSRSASSISRRASAMSWRRSSAFFSETPPQEASYSRRHLGGQAFPRRVALHHRREHVGHRLPGEGPATREELEEERPEGPDVRPLVQAPAASLLGGHVARGPEDDSRLGARLRQGRRLRQVRGGARGRVPGIGLRQAEVEHLHVAVGCELDVRRLEVAVDDPLLVRFLERFGDLPRDGQGHVDGNRAVPQALG